MSLPLMLGIAVTAQIVGTTGPTDPAFAGAWLAPILITVGVVLLGVIMTTSIRAKIASRQAEQPSPREFIDQIRADRARRDDVDTATSELLDTGQRLAAQLDNKAERLEQLIAQADQRLERLADATAEPGGPSPEPSPPPRAAAPPPAPDPPQPRAAPEASPPPAPPASLDPLTVAVYDLADAGQSAVEIAQELDEQTGKVELILALRETQVTKDS